MKKQIAEILGIELSNQWEITDGHPDEGLYLVHYTSESDLNQYGHIRGLVVDVEAKTVVCRSYGFTPTAIQDELKVEVDGKYHIPDIYGNEHVVDPSRVQIKMGFEGTIMRVFKHNGNVYHSTHRRLTTTRSRWGNSIPFEEMYHQLNGPKDEELFNPASDYSPYCHLFLMVHPDVLNVTKDQIGSGYLVYLGPKQMWSVDLDTCPYKQLTETGEPMGLNWGEDRRPNGGWIDDTLYLPQTLPEDNRGSPGTISPLNLNLEEANYHLRYGFYEKPEIEPIDQRIGTGEFVMLYKMNEAGQIEGLLKVESPAYQWRLEMRDNDPNLKHRFYQLVNGSYINTDTAEGMAFYRSRYPILHRHDYVDILSHLEREGPFISWPGQDVTEIKNRDDRMYNIWMCYIISVPIHRQMEVALMYQELQRDRMDVIKWLQSLDVIENLDSIDSLRAQNIIKAARQLAHQKMSDSKSSMANLVKDIIRNFIFKEEGTSLYRLVKAMKCAQTS